MASSGIYIITNGGDPRDYNCLSSCKGEVCGYLPLKYCPLYFSRDTAAEALKALPANIRKRHQVVEADSFSLLVFRPEALAQKEVQNWRNQNVNDIPTKEHERPC